MCLCEWSCVRASGHVSVRVGMCLCEWACVCASGHVSVRVGMCLCEWACVCASGHVSVRVGMCLCEWACVCASGHVSVRVGMCPCEWASGHVSVRVGIHVSMRVRWEGVKIMKGWESVWGDKTYLCGEMQVGTDAMRVRGNASMWVGQGGIHVRTCRWAWM